MKTIAAERADVCGTPCAMSELRQLRKWYSQRLGLNGR